MRAGPLELIYRDVIFGRYYHNDFMPSSSGEGRFELSCGRTALRDFSGFLKASTIENRRGWSPNRGPAFFHAALELRDTRTVARAASRWPCRFFLAAP